MANQLPTLPTAFHEQPEWLRVTLSCIGDGVITTDSRGLVTFLNPAAEALTGWTLAEASGVALDTVFHIVNENTRAIAENPVHSALRKGIVVGLANHTILIAKDGTERPIDDSAAPIRSASGEVAGVVHIFRDVTLRKREEQLVHDAQAYADNIIATLRVPFLVLDHDLRIVTANSSFYRNFEVAQAETTGQFVYDLGNRQWDIPALRTLLEEVLPKNQIFLDFEVEHDFPTLGRKTMLLNARRILKPGSESELILLAIEDISERKHGQVAQQESEERFRGTFENAAIGMAHVGLDGRWLKANQALCRIIGYTPEELATKTFADLTHPDDLDTDLSHVKRVLAGEIDNYAMEKRYVRKDGSYVHVNLTVSLLRDVAGNPLHFISAIEDISMKKAALAELERERRFNQRLTHVMPNVMYVFDLVKLCIRWVNPQVVNIMGYTEKEIIDRGSRLLPDLMHPNDLAKMPAYFSRLAEVSDGVALDIEYRLQQPSGEWRWFLGRKTPFTRDAEGRVVEILGTATDITDRKRAEEAQHESDQRSRLAVEATSLGIWEWNVHTGDIQWDAQMFRIYGITPTADGVVPYSTWTGTVFPDDLPRQEEILQETVRLCGRSSRQFRIVRVEDQEFRHIESVETVRLNEQGQVEWVVGTNVDVTDRVRDDRLLIAQAQVLELAASGAELQQVLDLVVRAAREYAGDHSRTSVFLVDPDGSHLRCAAVSGLPTAYCDAMDHLEIGPQSPSCGTAAFAGQTEIVGDVDQDPHWEPLLGLAREHDIRAVWSEPMKTLSGAVLGTLALYHRTPRLPQPGDLEAIRLLSQTTALVIERNRELTQRQRAEDSLRGSEQQLRRILDTMPPKIETTKPNGEVDYLNPQWSEYTGLPFEQLQGRGWKRVIHPEDLAEHVRLWQQAVQTGLPFEFESRLRRADGEYRWHISRALPMRDEAEKITMWVGSNSDIHDMKQAEAAVHNSEVRYRRLFEAAHDGILILDAASRQITHVNPFLTSLLDYPVEHFVGKELWEIGILSDKPASRAAMQQLDEKGSLRYENLPLQDRHGNYHPVELVANIYEEGSHQVIQCNIRDISDRVRLEILLRNQSVEMSDLHRRKDEFLAMLSHELRSPLAPIANAVQLLSLQPETETLIHKKARDIIQRQLGQLQHLVDDLLEVSRITTGRVQLRKERITVNRVVQGAVETTRPLIEQRGHTLSVTILPPPIWLNADPARLEQVVVNLLTNAAKYTEEGGELHLTAQMEGPVCVLRVRDNGVGISPTLLPRIFDLFTQAERSLDRSEGGLGIGLALVQRLTELHGGTVEVQSVLGLGSEFIVRLPLDSDEKPMAAGEREGARAASPSALATQLRVMVVDDNVDTVLSFSMLLQASGHEVLTAHDGLTALQTALDYRPDIMLLDIGLPGLNGYEVAKRVREYPQLQDVVLVALTGYGQDSDRATSLQAGFNHHMVKPASFEQIKLILASVLRLPR